MSFTPISSGLSTALSGAIEPTKFLDITRSDIRSDSGDKIIIRNENVRSDVLENRHIHGPSERKEDKIRYTIIIVMISAIIFVTTVSIYDVIRNALNTYYANLALTDPNSHNTNEDIERTKIANQNQLWSSMVFSAICIFSAIILILILIYMIK